MKNERLNGILYLKRGHGLDGLHDLVAHLLLPGRRQNLADILCTQERTCYSDLICSDNERNLQQL